MKRTAPFLTNDPKQAAAVDRVYATALAFREAVNAATDQRVLVSLSWPLNTGDFGDFAVHCEQVSP